MSRVLVGLMSGTSLDGIAAAVVRFSEHDDALRADLLAFDVVPYAPAQRARLAQAMLGGTAEEYCRLNYDLGEWLATAAQRVILEAGVPRAEIAAVASHGQTLWHVPAHSSWQLGESAVIAEHTGIAVLSNFRARDIAAGGQGAPLVPIADQLLFSHRTAWRALQNIGGIANVSVVAPATSQLPPRAFDTGPGVAVIDGVVRRLWPEMTFDLNGTLARQGRPIDRVVDDRLLDAFFRTSPPKSTGRELFTPEYIAAFVEACRTAGAGARDQDIVATAVELTARSIADAYTRYVPEPVAEVLVSGGGAKNPVLVGRIRQLLAPREVVDFGERYFDGEAKEAVAFALLGYLHLEGRPGNVPAATGARGPRVLGQRQP